MNPLKQLTEQGQSPWLDYIRRTLITSGELERMIAEDGLAGVTSNPAIFEKAITGSTDYADQLASLQQRKDLRPMDLYEQIAIRDIQDAADELRPVYDRTNGRDGYVSLEVSPFLAHDTQRTLDEAHRLWKEVDRRNLMLKVPGTPEGLPAIESLIGEGINVNITLLFSQEVYEKVALAYVSGLETLAGSGGDVSKVGSVASFFVSRIDALVESQIHEKLKTAAEEAERAVLKSLMGQVAIANAKLAYQRYKEIFSGPRWEALAAKGAHTQRILWASTSTKNPAYRDVLYVEELIGPDTVNTLPPATADAFRDHGKARPSLEEGLEQARNTMKTLEEAGISMREVTDQLVTQGVKLFAEAFDKLLNAVDVKCRIAPGAKISKQTHHLGAELEKRLEQTLDEWKISGKVRRLWARDASLWTNGDESEWLGWLGVTEDQVEHSQHLTDLGQETRSGGFTDAMVLGMGGSSLCPEVLAVTFGQQNGSPKLHVLDSTDPAQVRDLESRVDLERTLFIVSSKSGTTLEPNIFKKHFFKKVQERIGDKAGEHFVAVTDPGSALEELAESEGFRRVYHGVSSIGGRYSALSDFGMVPAAAMGLDADRFLDRADELAVSCSSCLPTQDNPGVVLGSILGLAGNEGRDKITLIPSPGIYDLGAWIEQLIAESTGKQGKALIPVDREKVGPPEVYGGDRLFVYVRLESAPDSAQDQAVAALEQAGHPVVRIEVEDLYDLGQEFFRWEFATAVAGSILGINPFNQPDVEASKKATKKLTQAFEETGELPSETPFYSENGIKLFTDEKNAAALKEAAGPDSKLADYLKAHLSRLEQNDYFALLAYIHMNEANEAKLQELRHVVRDKKRVATCLGFGPRFLHSTGQAYKGGPNSGVFLQVTCDDAEDLPVPGQKYSFGVVKAAQARGDFEVLAQRGRRALRVHLGADVAGDLAKLEAAVREIVT